MLYVKKGREERKEEEVSNMEGAFSYPGLPKVPAVLKFIKQILCFLTFRIWWRQWWFEL